MQYKNKKRLLDIIKQPNYIFASGNSFKGNNLEVKEYIKENGCRLYLTSKLLFYKHFYGERKKNEKTKFKNNMYLIIKNNYYTNEINYSNIIKKLKRNKIEINGAISNGKIANNFETLIYNNFDKKYLTKNLIITILYSSFSLIKVCQLS